MKVFSSEGIYSKAILTVRCVSTSGHFGAIIISDYLSLKT